jgi:hypothetical protein
MAMAQWRRRPGTIQPPAELLEFRPDDWIGPGQLDLSARQHWSDERFRWLLAHPGDTIDGMDAVDVIYET